jgi:ectoine hydroxylase-related dioxygenase (phytanoyl-CoA dioxygenase family)
VTAYRALVRRLEARDYDDSWMAGHQGAADAKPQPTKEGVAPRLRLNGLLRLDDAFHRLIDHPRVLPYLEEFMGGPQIINTWSITKGPDAWHGGWHRGMPAEHYTVRNGRIRTSMLNVVWFLDDNGPEDGCMVAIPGSHKNGIDLDLGASKHDEMPGMQRVVGRAGDVFLFSESVFHDGLRKTTAGARTNLYFNYGERCFNVMTFSPEHNRHFCMPPEVRARFSEKQREMSSWMRHCIPVEAPLAEKVPAG